MKYCTCCEKMRETHTRVTETRWWWKASQTGKATEYVREVCIRCQSPLLIAEEPADTSPIKISKKDKRREKQFNKMIMRGIDGWPSLGQKIIGVQASLAGHCVWGAGVGGSNPPIPTKYIY